MKRFTNFLALSLIAAFACSSLTVQAMKLNDAPEGEEKVAQGLSSVDNVLFKAAAEGSLNDVHMALALEGVNINARDYAGRTPLHCAAIHDNVDAVGVLFEYAANINVCDDSGCTPLYYAACFGYFPVVKLLLQNNADITIRSNLGETPYGVIQRHVDYNLKQSAFALYEQKAILTAIEKHAEKNNISAEKYKTPLEVE